MICSHSAVKFLLTWVYHLSIDMKKYLTIILTFFFCITSFSQENKIFIGASTNYNLPLGMMANRMEGNVGFSVYAGRPVSSDWTWIGKFDYFKLNEVNKDEMRKFIKSDALGDLQTFEFKLPKMKMEFTAAGLTAEAKYKLIYLEEFDINFNFGFGFYFWEYFRESYKDSLTIDSAGTGTILLIEELNVPALRQKDWNGALNFGTDVNLNFFNPVTINISANYKLLIAELWSTLALNLENVSGIQFLELRAGLRYNF